MMAELPHSLTASTGIKQTTDTALTAPLHHTTTNSEKSNSPECSTSQRKHKYYDFHSLQHRFPCHRLIRAMTSMNWVRILRWQHLIIESLSLPRFKFNAYFRCIYYTEQDQFVRYINTSIIIIIIKLQLCCHPVAVVLLHVYVTLKDRKRSLRGKTDHNALWH